MVHGCSFWLRNVNTRLNGSCDQNLFKVIYHYFVVTWGSGVAVEAGDHPALERLADDYGPDTARAVQDFYDGNSFPQGDPEEVYKTLRTRLHRIYPEAFSTYVVDDDRLKHAYVAVDEGVEGNGSSDDICKAFYRKPYDLDEIEDIEAVVLDHCVLGDIVNKRNRIGEKVDEPVSDVVEDYLEDNLPGTFWYNGLDIMDDVLTANNQEQDDISIKIPAGTVQRFRRKPEFDTTVVNEVFRYLDKVTEEMALPENPRQISGYENAVEDRKIAEAAERENALVVSTDEDFVGLESEFDISVASPDLAEYLLEQRYGL